MMGTVPVPIRILAVIVAVLTLLPLLPAVSAAEQTNDVRDDIVTIYPSELLDAILFDVYGTHIPSYEATWLDGEAGNEISSCFTLEYSTALPIDLLNIEIMEPDNQDNVIITVSAEDYGHEGVLWSPVAITVKLGEDSRTTELQNGTRECIFELSLDSMDDVGHIKVFAEYETKFSFTSEEYHTLANAAYSAACDAQRLKENYERAKAVWDEHKEVYDDYLEKMIQYNAELQKYNAYIRALDAYNVNMVEYNDYIADMDKYKADLNKYNEYLNEYNKYRAEYEKYLDFLEDPAKYVDAYEDYCDWLLKMKKVSYQLDLIESCFVTDSAGHKLYATLHGDTVATVVQNQDALVSTGCNADDIANADRATARLTALLDAYPKNKTEAEKYAYYIANYSLFRDSVTLLYTSLARLYTNDAVPSILEAKGKLERYWQFVSQLYVLHCSLDDNTALNSNWTIAGMSPSSLLEDCYMLNDTNSATPFDSYPQEVKEAISPAEIKCPIEPAAVTRPHEPEEIIEPTKPDEVRRPILPVAVTSPGDAPIKPCFSRAVSTMIERLEAQELSEREMVGENVVYRARHTIGAARSLDGYATLSLYNSDGSTLLNAVSVARGRSVSLENIKADAFKDRKNIYSFSCWIDGEGNRKEGSIALLDDMILIATYEKTARKYAVKWKVNGEEYTTEFEYGEMPSFDLEVSDYNDGENSYAFDGWSPFPVAVTEDTTYSAMYTAEPRFYEVTWKWGDNTLSEMYRYGSIPSFKNGTVIDEYIEDLQIESGGRYRYSFIGWHRELQPVYADVEYVAVITSTDIFPDLPDNVFLSIIESSSGLTLTAEGVFNDSSTFSVVVDDLLALCNSRALILKLDEISLYIRRDELAKITRSHGMILYVEYHTDSFTVTFLDDEGNDISRGISVAVTLGQNEGRQTRVLLGEEEIELSYSSDGSIIFDALMGKKYSLESGYRIVCHDADGGICSVKGGYLGKSGDIVYVSVLCRPGYVSAGIKVSTTDGKNVDVSEDENCNLFFLMPDGEAVLTPIFERLKYTVIFISDGTIISQKEYFYGDTVIPPDDPEKQEDEEYTYRFAGWNIPVKSVSADAVYEAVFLPSRKSDISSVPKASLDISQMILICVSSCVIVTSSALTVFFVSRKKKNQNA